MKLEQAGQQDDEAAVALRGRAWIEIRSPCKAPDTAPVALRGRAWIEIQIQATKSSYTIVALRGRAWIEINTAYIFTLRIPASPSAGGRGLKLFQRRNGEI